MLKSPMTAGALLAVAGLLVSAASSPAAPETHTVRGTPARQSTSPVVITNCQAFVSDGKATPSSAFGLLTSKSVRSVVVTYVYRDATGNVLASRDVDTRMDSGANDTKSDKSVPASNLASLDCAVKSVTYTDGTTYAYVAPPAGSPALTYGAIAAGVGAALALSLSHGNHSGANPPSAPTNSPTNAPTNSPTNTPTNSPTNTPTNSPTNTPTNSPTNAPTNSPTNTPTNSPTNTPTNSPTSAPTNSPTMSPNALTISPSSLTFTSVPTSAPVTVSEKNYTGALTLTNSSCSAGPGNTTSNVAAVSPGSGTGPSATFTVNATGAGTCTFTFSDASGATVQLSVSVTTTAVTIQSKRRFLTTTPHQAPTTVPAQRQSIMSTPTTLATLRPTPAPLPTQAPTPKPTPLPTPKPTPTPTLAPLLPPAALPHGKSH